MARYEVSYERICMETVEVEAGSEDIAIEKAIAGDGDVINTVETWPTILDVLLLEEGDE